MSLPGFYALGSAWLFLLLIPLIIFYFLKLKRPRLRISSLVLWRQVINDQRVNSPFQKFKRNLLLLLQMVLLCLLVLAAMQPFLASAPQRAVYLPVLIDCSASMAALDKPGGTSRLEEAKARVRDLIDKLLPDQRLSLIAFHSTARRLTDFTDNKRLLRQALDKLTVSQVGSRLEDALRMTQALARGVPIGMAIMLTDGNIPPEVDFELPFEVNYQLIPQGGTNIGITGANARRAGPRSWDVFVRIESSGAGESSAKVSLKQNGHASGEESVLLEPGKSQRLVFRVEAAEPTSIEVRLQPEGFDSLESDNVAFLDLPAARPLNVYISGDLASYRHALKGLPGLNLYPSESNDGSPPTEYDLVITDSKDEQPLETTVGCYVGLIPDDLQKLVKIDEGSASFVDWQRNSELLEHVQLSGIQTTEDPHSVEGTQDAAYEELGYEILAFGRAGPLILKKRSGAKVAYYILFHTDRSTFPYRVGFPIMAANLVHTALQQAALSEIAGTQTGVLPPQSFQPNHPYQVRAPDGAEIDVATNESGVVSGVPAQEIGEYVFSNQGKELARVGVSLLAPQETSLAAVESIRFPEMTVRAAETTIKNDRPLWPTLALLAFGVLLVEWWYFQRPPGGIAR